MAIFEVPLSPDPQTFNITLNQVTYQMTVRWRAADQGGWTVDIADATGAPLINGIPMVTGADLLAQYAYLGIVGGLFVATDHAPNEVPEFGNLGIEAHLYFVAA